jgi:hypothetical protein
MGIEPLADYIRDTDSPFNPKPASATLSGAACPSSSSQ